MNTSASNLGQVEWTSLRTFTFHQYVNMTFKYVKGCRCMYKCCAVVFMFLTVLSGMQCTQMRPILCLFALSNVRPFYT